MKQLVSIHVMSWSYTPERCHFAWKNRDFKIVVEQRHLDATMQCRESHGDGSPLQIDVMFVSVHA